MESTIRTLAERGIFRVVRRDVEGSAPPTPILGGHVLGWNTLPALHTSTPLAMPDDRLLAEAEWAPPDFAGIVASPPATTRLERLPPVEARAERLRPEIECERYLERWTPGYETCVRKLARSIPAMEPHCQATICIPVAATEEHFIGETILSLQQQTAPPESFELLLLVNLPDQASHLHDNLTRTLEAIQNARRTTPDLRTHLIIVGTGDAATRTIGFLRALVTDLALFRHLERCVGRDHLLFRWDADTRGVDRSLIENMLRRASDYPDADSFRGQTLPSPERLTKDPPLFVSYMLPGLAQRACRGERRSPNHGGPNHAIRASSYAAIGGYDDLAAFGEDIQLAQALVELRPPASRFIPVMYAGSRSRLYTSTRRGTQAVALGSCAAAQWSFAGTRFGPTDEHVRLLPENAARQGLALEPQALLNAVGFQINRTLASLNRITLGAVSLEHPRLQRILRQFFGFRFQVLDGTTVALQDGSAFLERMARLAERGLQAWRDRLAFLPTSANDRL